MEKLLVSGWVTITPHPERAWGVTTNTTGFVGTVIDGVYTERLQLTGGVAGVCASHGGYYVATRHPIRPKLLRLDSHLAIQYGYSMHSGCDPHGVFVEPDGVSLVSGAEDTVYYFTPDLKHIRTETFGVGGVNRFHVNDVYRIGSEWAVTMFTDKADGSWAVDVPYGFLKTGKEISPSGGMRTELAGLCKPHSPVVADDDLWVCDSARGALWRNGTKLFQEKRSWTRGAYVGKDFVYVGVSDFNCATFGKIVVLTKGGDVVREIKLPFSSIYSVLPLSE